MKIGTAIRLILGFQMALFCSPFKPPILCPKFPRNCYAIQSPLKPRTSILKTSKITISAPTKILNNKAKCSSNLSSSGELDEEPPCSAVIFVKGIAFYIELTIFKFFTRCFFFSFLFIYSLRYFYL